MSHKFDEIDLKILSILRYEGGTTPKAEVARRVKLTPTAVFERIRKLRDSGVIRGYHARLDPHALGLGLLAYIFVSETGRTRGKSLGSSLARLDHVEEVHRIAGEDCFLVKIRAADTNALNRALDDVRSLPGVSTTRTTIVLNTVFETGGVNVPRRIVNE